MNRPTNDNLPRLLSWIGENYSTWLLLCAGSELEQGDFIETLRSLKEAGLYQIILVLVTGASRYNYLHQPLQRILSTWYEQQLTSSAMDGMLSR